MNHQNKQSQFEREQNYFLEKLDFLNWYRYFFILKEIIRLKPQRILEIGEGSGIVRRTIEPVAKNYETMDINENLKPTHLNDIRNFIAELKEKFDCIIAADILEHIPFDDFEKSLKNIFNYLKDGGYALITIPHRASYFLLMTPTYQPKVIRIPTGFCSPGAFYRRFIKRKIWIDPDHEWEIGDGKHTIKDIEKIMKNVGFKIEKREKLLYVDFWVLEK